MLLGTWASLNVPTLSIADLDLFEDLVNCDTIEIYNLLTLRTSVLEGSGLDNEVVRRIVKWCEGRPLGTASSEEYERVKKEHNMI